jgi:hypothetical protein
MKIIINSLIHNIANEKENNSLSNNLDMTREAHRLELAIQGELDRKRNIRDNLNKITQLGLAPPQMKITEKNPLIYFGDLLTAKETQIEETHTAIKNLQVQLCMTQRQVDSMKMENKLLSEKKSKISHTLQSKPLSIQNTKHNNSKKLKSIWNPIIPNEFAPFFSLLYIIMNGNLLKPRRISWPGLSSIIHQETIL